MAGRNQSFSASEFKTAPITTRSRSNSTVRRQEKKDGTTTRSTSDPLDLPMAQFELRSKKGMEESKDRIQKMAKMERIIANNGIEKASDILLYDPFILSLMLAGLNENNSWDIGLAHEYLAIIVNNEMLLEPLCVSACLDSLQLICDTLLGNIINAIQQSNLGVDVTAEERRDKATKILKILCNLRDTHQVLCKKMSQDNASRLDQIAQILRIL